jgi:hypothetical protein
VTDCTLVGSGRPFLAFKEQTRPGSFLLKRNCNERRDKELTSHTKVINYIRRNKEWIFSGIGVVILVGLFSFVGRSFRSKETEKKVAQLEGSEIVMVLPDNASNESPRASDWKEIANQALAQIRERDRVGLMDAIHNELTFTRLPRGVFGYIMGYGLNHLDITPISHSKYPSYFEIHKTLDGDAVVVGFISPETAQRISRDDTPRDFEFTMYSEAWSDASAAIALPLKEFTLNGSARSIDLDGKQHFGAVDIVLKPGGTDE